jgi:hypothetical protein
VSDPTDRELYLSLGSTLENIARAASSIGQQAAITYLLQGELVASVELAAGAEQAADFRPAMVERRSTRLPFLPEPLGADLAATLRQIQRGSVKLTIIEDKTAIEAIARISGEASGRLLGNPAFRKELAGWVRNNWTKQPDGMPGFAQGIPGPVSLLAPIVVGNTNIGPVQAKKDHVLFSASAAVIVLGVEQDDQTNWLDAGRMFEAVCLEAQMQGCQTSALGSAIEDDQGLNDVKAALGVSYRPVAIIRMGKASGTSRHSPRRSAEDATDR